MDADDELPVFSSEFYTMTLTENGNGSRVILGRVLATDADTPPYNQMLYYIEPSDAVSSFLFIYFFHYLLEPSNRIMILSPLFLFTLIDIMNNIYTTDSIYNNLCIDI